MSRVQTLVQLTEEILDLLDRRAAREGVSRSAVIREAVESYLASDVELRVDEAIVEGYRRVPQGDEFDRDEWGDLDDLGEAWKATLVEHVTTLPEERMREICRALNDAVGCRP